MESRKIWGTLDPFHEGGAFMGRSVANESFLRALLALDPCDEYHFFLRDEALAEGVDAFLAREFGPMHAGGRFLIETRAALPAALEKTDYHVFHLSDCINYPAHLARLRNAVAPRIFPITGATHSLSYSRYMNDFLAHMWPGCTSRDCVIATSSTAVGVVNAIYDGLDEDFGGLSRPHVERIPLGVDTRELQPPTSEERAEARKRFGLAEGECAFLVFARVSQYSKMDMLPVLRAVRRMPGLGVPADRIRLIVAGWMDGSDEYPEFLQELASNAGVSLDIVPRPDDEAKRALYHAADVFLSPVDNPQETFGLTVLEAAAAGLPCVVSEYDGYRDLVVPGQTGLLTPTLGPGATDGLDAMAPMMFERSYHLLLAQQVVVDVPALARDMAVLATDGALRARMGAAARERVEREFTWSFVVERHVALWDRLWEQPVDEGSLRDRKHPLQMAFGRVFAGYPTQVFGPDIKVQWSRTGEAVYREQDFITVYGDLEDRVEPDTVKRAVFFARKPLSAEVLAGKIAASCAMAEERARFLVLWAMKHDLLERVDDGD